MSMYDKAIFRKLYIKNGGLTGKTDKNQLHEDYYNLTGVHVSQGSMNRLVTQYRKTEQYKDDLESHTETIEDESSKYKQKVKRVPNELKTPNSQLTPHSSKTETAEITTKTTSQSILKLNKLRDTGKQLTEADILEIFGLSPVDFELKDRAGSGSIWGNEEDERTSLRIEFQKREKTEEETLFEVISNYDFKSKTKTPNKTASAQTNMMLSVFLTDLHFGYMRAEHYKEQQSQIIDIINQRNRKEAALVIGSDLFHVNTSKGETERGTQVGYEISKDEMYTDALDFYVPIIEALRENTETIKGFYVSGNHDRDMAYGFAFALSLLYPDIKWDLQDTEVRKTFTSRGVTIIYTHGDQPRGFKKSIAEVVKTENKKAYGLSKTFEVHSGDKHHRWQQEEHGVLIRGFGSPKASDKWHVDNGFVGSARVMHLLEYTEKHQFAEYLITTDKEGNEK